MDRWRFLLFSFLAIALAWAWPSHAQTALRLGLHSLPVQLDPHLAVTRSEQILARELFVGLTTLDPEGKVVPGLAESWSISPEKEVYTFTLRDNLAWSDGQALNATTIVKSFERALDPTTLAPFAAQLLTIKNAEKFRLGTLGPGEKLGITARDQRTVEFHLNAPSQRFLQLLAQPVAMPVPLHRMTKSKVEWATPDSVIGNGPYTLTPESVGYGLSKNQQFFAPAVFEKIELRAFASLPEASDALRKNEIDLVFGFTAEPRSDRPQNRISIEGEGLDSYLLLANVSHPPLDSRELRHALGMVIDRAELIKSLRLDGAEPAFNIVPAPPYSPFRAPYAKLNRADRRIVAEALLLDIDPSHIPPLRLVYPMGQMHQAIAEFVAKAWRELGFKVDVMARSESAYEQALRDGNYDAAVATAWQQAATLDSILSGYSQGAGPWNATRYREQMFEQSLTNADIEIAPEFYVGLLRQAEGVLIEDQVAWPLLFYPAGVIAKAKYTGLSPNAAHIHLLRYLAPAPR